MPEMTKSFDTGSIDNIIEYLQAFASPRTIRDADVSGRQVSVTGKLDGEDLKIIVRKFCAKTSRVEIVINDAVEIPSTSCC